MAQHTDRRRVTRPADTSRLAVSDVRQLSLPVQLAAGLILTAITATLSASAAIWANQRSNDAAFSALDTKVQLILKEMDGERRVAEGAAKLQDSNYNNMNKSIEAAARRLEAMESKINNDRTMLQIQIGTLEKSIVALTTGRK